MRNKKTITGKLTIINRLNSSIDGNPRFLVEINNQYFKTTPDAMFGYSVQNFDGQTVNAVIGKYYNQDSIFNAEAV